MFDTGLIHKGSVSTIQILNDVSVCRLDKLCMVPRNMLIIEDDIGVALPSNHDFGRDEWQDILLTVRT